MTIREDNATAALEVMSRFAANPKWLIYLPPTMSPCETSSEAGLLEHPAEAFAYYRSQGTAQVVCEEKHMGSRAVIVVCRDQDAARERFGVTDGESGIVYTRTGRRFFYAPDVERELLSRLQAALSASQFWDHFQTSWVCLDCELMPWSAKAQDPLRSQYAAVGAAGKASLPHAVAALQQAAHRLDGEARIQIVQMAERFAARQQHVDRFVAAYRHYCWPVESLDDLKLGSFHLLASEGTVHVHQNHVWHMEALGNRCRHDPALLLTTDFKVVDVTVPTSEVEGIAWWSDLTGRGGEGMVIKPFDFCRTGGKGWCSRRLSAADPNTSASFTAPTTRPTSICLGCETEASAASGRWRSANSRWESKPWSDSCGENRCGECMSASSAFWPLESEPVDPRL